MPIIRGIYFYAVYKKPLHALIMAVATLAIGVEVSGNYSLHSVIIN